MRYFERSLNRSNGTIEQGGRISSEVTNMTKLRTSQERTKMLRAGIDEKTIERLYVELNGLFVLNVAWGN